jgi:hypothetical protein
LRIDASKQLGRHIGLTKSALEAHIASIGPRLARAEIPRTSKETWAVAALMLPPQLRLRAGHRFTSSNPSAVLETA